MLRHNIFDFWDGEQPNVVKVANVLNKIYFSDELIIKSLQNIFSVLSEGGLLLIAENRKEEKAALYQKKGFKFELVSSTKARVEIDDLVQQIRSAVPFAQNK